MPDRLPLALSVQQPWAWLIVWGLKPVENRTWPTAGPRAGVSRRPNRSAWSETPSLPRSLRPSSAPTARSSWPGMRPGRR